MTDNREWRAISPEETAVIIKNGHLDGLEYAWVTDEAPTRWPRPDEMEVIPD
jgi:hypothetical protein